MVRCSQFGEHGYKRCKLKSGHADRHKMVVAVGTRRRNLGDVQRAVQTLRYALKRLYPGKVGTFTMVLK